ncbi:hypothetical protein LguiB_015760 [Lonicera macranthoides]
MEAVSKQKVQDSGRSSFGERCSRLAKKQRAKFYILRRCIAMLVFPPHTTLVTEDIAVSLLSHVPSTAPDISIYICAVALPHCGEGVRVHSRRFR